eukprot:541018-Pyramimonas_sp.AAC.1
MPTHKSELATTTAHWRANPLSLAENARPRVRMEATTCESTKCRTLTPRKAVALARCLSEALTASSSSALMWGSRAAFGRGKDKVGCRSQGAGPIDDLGHACGFNGTPISRRTSHPAFSAIAQKICVAQGRLANGLSSELNPLVQQILDL